MEITEELKNIAAIILEKSKKEVKPDLDSFTLLLNGWIDELT